MIRLATSLSNITYAIVTVWAAWHLDAFTLKGLIGAHGSPCTKLYSLEYI